MSSREIASLTDKRHDNVKRTIDYLFVDHLIQHPQVEDYEIINGLGIKTYGKEYFVNQRDSYVVVARLSPEFTAKLVDRWRELEGNAQKPVANLSDASTLRELLLGYTEQVIQLQATVEAQKPAVAFHECVKASINSQSIEEVAKALGTGRNRMYQFLRQQGLLKMDNSPYQEYIDRDYFEVELRTYKDKNFKDVTYPMTMVTGRGVDYIYRKFF
jgi:phage regulator Rha-like protein